MKLYDREGNVYSAYKTKKLPSPHSLYKGTVVDSTEKSIDGKKVQFIYYPASYWFHFEWEGQTFKVPIFGNVFKGWKGIEDRKELFTQVKILPGQRELRRLLK